MSSKLQKAISAVRMGDKQTGRQLLAEVLQADPLNEIAWVWMSFVVSDERRRDCLERALTINPNNDAARRSLARLVSSTKANSSDVQRPLEAVSLSMETEAMARQVFGDGKTTERSVADPSQAHISRKGIGLLLLFFIHLLNVALILALLSMYGPNAQNFFALYRMKLLWGSEFLALTFLALVIVLITAILVLDRFYKKAATFVLVLSILIEVIAFAVGLVLFGFDFAVTG